MTRARVLPGAILAAVLLTVPSGCGTVDVPRENFWRLDLPAPAGGELPRGGPLRVADLQLGNALDGDCLLVADGPVSLEPLEMQRWVAPLDRLVTDAVVLGLSRTRMFTLVLGAGDPGREDHTLYGRIVDFAEHRRADGDVALVVLEFWLARGDAILFQEEFRAEVALHGTGPAAMVAALSRGLQQVLDALVGHMRGAGVFTREIDSTPAK